MAATQKIIASAIFILAVVVLTCHSAPSSNTTTTTKAPHKSPQASRQSGSHVLPPSVRANTTRTGRSAGNVARNRTSSETSEEETPSGTGVVKGQHFQIFPRPQNPASSSSVQQDSSEIIRSNPTNDSGANATRPGHRTPSSHFLLGQGVVVN